MIFFPSLCKIKGSIQPSAQPISNLSLRILDIEPFEVPNLASKIFILS